ncbi:MAG: H-NS histone family protein [Methylobacter sp.]|jgi:DNA-binding protein H-NS|nr:H-NS histone family protein [Methylobacter sp.]
MTDFQNKTPEELQQLLADAQAQLKIIQRNKHKDVIAQIKALADSIGATVDIYDNTYKVSTKVLAKVSAKYRHPDNEFQTWSGRGITPKWLIALVEAGHNKDDFLIRD